MRDRANGDRAEMSKYVLQFRFRNAADLLICRSIAKMLKADQDAHGPVDVDPILAAAVRPPADDEDSGDEDAAS